MRIENYDVGDIVARGLIFHDAGSQTIVPGRLVEQTQYGGYERITKDLMDMKQLFEVFVIDRAVAETQPAAITPVYIVADCPEAARTTAVILAKIEVADLVRYHVHSRVICGVPLLKKSDA